MRLKNKLEHFPPIPFHWSSETHTRHGEVLQEGQLPTVSLERKPQGKGPVCAPREKGSQPKAGSISGTRTSTSSGGIHSPLTMEEHHLGAFPFKH